MKKIIPIVLAALVFVAAFFFLTARKGKQVAVITAAWDLPAGHTLIADDVVPSEISAENAPAGAFSDPELLIGQTLRVDRTGGDLIVSSHLGGQKIVLAADERAIAVEVTDSAGLAGLLQAGDRVGLTAVMMSSQGSYAKMITEGLRVLYISPEFRSLDPAAYEPDPEDEGSGFSGNAPSRVSKGVVVLAVPVSDVVVAYDFASFGVDSESRTINVIDLLPALDHISNVSLSLFIQPDNSTYFTTSGVSVDGLVITPGPSPTPTPNDGYRDEDEEPETTPEATPVPEP